MRRRRVCSAPSSGWVGLGPLAVDYRTPPPRYPRWCSSATWAGAGGTVIIYLAALIGVRA